MTTLYKAVRPDGTDFHTGTVQWAPPDGHDGEWIVRHPTSSTLPDMAGAGFTAADYLSVATVPTDCTGMEWPCRLLTVEPLGGICTPDHSLPNKRAGVAFRVTGEVVPSHAVFGPHGEQVAALIDRAASLTVDDSNALAAARDVARDVAWTAARDTARAAAWTAAWDVAASHARAAARDVAWDVARALVVRDLITTEHYDTLTMPWRTTIGPIHPDDPDMRGDR